MFNQKEEIFIGLHIYEIFFTGNSNQVKVKLNKYRVHLNLFLKKILKI